MRRSAASPRASLMRDPDHHRHPVSTALSEPTSLLPPTPTPPTKPGARHGLPLLAVAVVITLPSLLYLFGRSSPSATRPESRSLMDSPSAARTANAAGLRLFAAAAAAPRTDVLLSPLSLSRALALAAEGATQGSASQSELRALAPSFIAQPKTPSDVTLALATSAWLGDVVNASYAESARALGAEARGGAKSVQAVNEWVRKATRGTISTILDTLPSPLVALLVDASYFKAPWTTTFDKSRSRKREFRGLANDVTMMRSQQKQKFMYAQMPLALSGDKAGSTVQIAELPYGKTKQFSALVVLPAEDALLDDVVNALNKDGVALWDSWTGALREEKLDLFSLPRFKLEFGAQGMKDVLGQVGVTTPFQMNSENPPFARMTADPDAYLKDVFHKATVEVSEEGTVASAASVAVVMTRSLPRPGPTLIADRPFLFAIRHVESGYIMFIGRVDKPVEF